MDTAAQAEATEVAEDAMSAADRIVRASEARYRALVDALDAGFCVIEVMFEGSRAVDYRFLEANPAFIEQTGLNGAIGRTMRELAPTHEEYWFETYGKVALSGEPVRFEAPAVALGRWYDVYAFRLGDPAERRVAILFSDVAPRKRAEAALRDSEARFRALATASADALYRMSPDWSEMHQLDGRGFISDITEPSDGWMERYIHPDDHEQVSAAIKEAVRAKRAFTLEHRVVRADGTLGWTSSRAVPLLGEDGEITEWIGAASDVTAHHDAEEELRASEARYRALFKEMDQAYAVVEVIADDTGRWVDFRFIEVNPAFTVHTGMPYPVGRTATELLGTPNPRWAEVYGQVAETGESVRLEEPEATLGRVFDLNVFRLGGPGSRRVAVLFTDVSDRKRSEAVVALERMNRDRDALRRQLLEAEEGERRRLSRELHDETGQLLTALGLGLQALSDVTAPGSEVDRRAADLGVLVNTMGQKLHAVAVGLRPKALDDFGLEPALAAYAEEWSRRTQIAVDMHVPTDAERLPGSVESALYRVVQEALTNVSRHSGAQRVSVVVERHDGHVVAVVEDDGRGFDPDGLTQSADRVPGYGLLGMRERVTLLGGTVEVESAPGAGATIFARIPIHSATAGAFALSDRAQDRRVTSERRNV